MHNLTFWKIELLRSIHRIIAAIDEEIDWYIASFTTKDRKYRLFAKLMFQASQKERQEIAKEEYERYQ